MKGAVRRWISGTDIHVGLSMLLVGRVQGSEEIGSISKCSTTPKSIVECRDLSPNWIPADPIVRRAPLVRRMRQMRRMGLVRIRPCGAAGVDGSGSFVYGLGRFVNRQG